MSSLILFLIILLTSQVFARIVKDFSGEAVRCLMLREHHSPCNILGGHPVPNSLIQAFRSLPKNVQNELGPNNLPWNLTANEYGMINPIIWLLMPVERLSKLPGLNLSTILNNWPDESSVAAQIMHSLPDATQRTAFINGLDKNVTLSERVQSIIASAVSTWEIDKEWNLPLIVKFRDSLLAHFPPEFLLASDSTFAQKIIFFIQNSSEDWMGNLNIVRKWAQVLYRNYMLRKFTNDEWSYLELHRFRYILPGMTTDELCEFREMDMTNVSAKEKRIILEMRNFDMQKTRTLFDIFYPQETLSKNDYLNCEEILSKLTPVQLQKFDITKFRLDNVKVFTNLGNYPAVKQLAQMFIAQNMLNGKLSINSEVWDYRDIKYFGNLIMGLPVNTFILYSSHDLGSFDLSVIESPQLTFTQAYYLTRNGTSFNLTHAQSVTPLHHFLQALPAASIRRVNDMSDIRSRTWLHLLEYLPGNNLPRTIGLFAKIDEVLGGPERWAALLKNPANNEGIRNLPSVFLRNIAKEISDDLKTSKEINKYRDEIMRLPTNLLSLLLDVNRKGLWTWNDFVNVSKPLHLFINGLTCLDIQQMENTDFILIISLYNRVRKSLGLAFPKNLQYCSQKKLIEYLEIKSRIMQYDKNEGLMTLMEPGEIEAVGGYIMASFPPMAIAASKYRRQILALIGQLSAPELMLAFSNKERREIINIFMDEHKLNEEKDTLINATHLFQLGNLILFLPSSFVERIEPSGLRLILENNHTDKRLCVDSVTRSEWVNLIIREFEDPSKWTGGVLSTLGDFLLAVKDDHLKQISRSAWLDVGVTFSNRYYDTIEWWLQDISYYKACVSTMKESEASLYLSEIKKLVRWQLKLAQWELDTVKSASVIIHERLKPKKSSVIHYFKNNPKDITRQPFSKLFENQKNPVNLREEISSNFTDVPVKIHDLVENSTKSSGIHYFKYDLIDITRQPLSKVFDIQKNPVNFKEEIASSEVTDMPVKILDQEEFEESTSEIVESNVTNDELETIMVNQSLEYANSPVPTTEKVSESGEKTLSKTNYFSFFDFLSPEKTENLFSLFSKEISTAKPYEKLNGSEGKGTTSKHFKNWNKDDTNEESESQNTKITHNVDQAMNDSAKYTSSSIVLESNKVSDSSDVIIESTVDNLSETTLINDSLFTTINMDETNFEDGVNSFDESISETTLNENDQSSYDFIQNDSTPRLKFTTEIITYGTISKPSRSLSLWEYFIDSLKESSSNDMHEKSEPEITDNKTRNVDYLINDSATNNSTAIDLETSTPISIITSDTTEISEPDIRTTNIESTTKKTEILHKSTDIKNGKTPKSVEAFADTTKSINFTSAFSSKKILNSNMVKSSEGIETENTQKYDRTLDRFSTENVGTLGSVTATGTTMFVTAPMMSTLVNEPIENFSSTSNVIKDEPILIKSENLHATENSPIETDHSDSVTDKKYSVSSENVTLSITEINNHSSIHTPIVKTSIDGEMPISQSNNLVNNQIKNHLFVDDTGEDESIELTTVSKIDLIRRPKELFEDAQSSQEEAEIYSGETQPDTDKYATKMLKRRKRSANSGRSPSNSLIQTVEFADSIINKAEENGKFVIQKREANEHFQTKISCEAIRTVGEISHLALDETDLENISDMDIGNCLDIFRISNFPYKMKKKIWQRVGKNDLHLYGSLIQACEIKDLRNMNFSLNSPWTLETLSFFSASLPEPKTVEYVLEKIMENNDPDKVGPEGIVSFSKLLCRFSPIDRVALLSSKQDLHFTTAILGQIEDCSQECLSDLVNFAKDEGIFGDPSNWNSYDVASLGVIPAGLSRKAWEDLLSNGKMALLGLQPSAAKCLTREKLEVISLEDLSLIPMKTARVIFKEKNHFLRKKQIDTLSSLMDSDSISSKLLSKPKSLDPNIEDPPNVITAAVLYISLIVLTILLSMFLLFRCFFTKKY